MYLLYVDESGDPGPKGSDEFFVLSGLVIHEARWPACFRMVKDLRVALREQYGIRRNRELHANKNIAGRGAMWGQRWPVADRVRLFQLVLETVSQMPGVRAINVCIRKNAPQFSGVRGRRIHDTAWTFMLQRFHNFVAEARSGGAQDYGMVIHDRGHEVETRKLMRRLRVYNPLPSRFGPSSRNVPLVRLIEDVVPRDAYHAQFIQLCDYMAYSLLRRERPVAKYPGMDGAFEILRPILLTKAAVDDPDGVVRYPKS